MYHSFKRHCNLTNEEGIGEGLIHLLNAFNMREKQQFHASKMVLWQWLKDKTTNGHTYYAFGKEASLDSIVYRILEKASEEIKSMFTIKVAHSTICPTNNSHNSCRNFLNMVFPLSSDDVLDSH